eukprot:8447226-Pyramimonas_sp.AAC.1
MFRQVVGRKNSVIWRAGAQPAVAHGAGVSGMTDSALVTARSVAATMVGAPPRAHKTAYLY